MEQLVVQLCAAPRHCTSVAIVATARHCIRRPRRGHTLLVALKIMNGACHAQIILLIIAEPIKLRQYMYACTCGSARLMYGTNEHLVV